MLPPPTVRFRLFVHDGVPATALPTTSADPAFSSTERSPAMELSNISVEFAVAGRIEFLPTPCADQGRGRADLDRGFIVFELQVAVAPHTELLAPPGGMSWMSELPPLVAAGV